VLDTATALQLRAAGEIVLTGARELVVALTERAREHVDTVCVGRTHGVHAEPTTFGIKLAGYAMEAQLNAERLERAFARCRSGAISSAVGTYSATSPQFELRVLERLGLEREPVSTQVVARDRHAELLQAIALAGAGLERFATEIRHLQRTEVREVEEPFRSGQKGSSAMPHKRNPITTERLTGLAWVLRGYASAAVENVALWHERDISHSGAERVILPDSTILLDYMQHLAIRMARGMVVHEDRMLHNLDLTCGALFSQRALLALIDTGLQRDEVLPDHPGQRDAAGTATRRCASCSRSGISVSTSMRCSTCVGTPGTRTRSWISWRLLTPDPRCRLRSSRRGSLKSHHENLRGGADRSTGGSAPQSWCHGVRVLPAGSWRRRRRYAAEALPVTADVSGTLTSGRQTEALLVARPSVLRFHVRGDDRFEHRRRQLRRTRRRARGIPRDGDRRRQSRGVAHFGRQVHLQSPELAQFVCVG
jgi:hypothetical protein